MPRAPRLLVTTGIALVVLGAVVWFIAGTTPPVGGWIGAPPPEPPPESFDNSLVIVQPLRLWGAALAAAGALMITGGSAYMAGMRARAADS